MIDRFVGERLRQARVARMWTATYLAEQLGVSAPAVSKYESGATAPRPEIVDRLAGLLQLPRAFFFGRPLDADDKPFFQRSFASSTKRARDSAEVRTEWLRECLAFIEPVAPLPKSDVPVLWDKEDPCNLDNEEIEEFAVTLRSHWGMGIGPIANVTGLLESKGIVVSCFSLNDPSLDAFSKPYEIAPVVVENSDRLTACRMRFDLCHELAHLALHRYVPTTLGRSPSIHKKMEDQAHRFSAAFLFPADSFLQEIYSVAVPGLLEAKGRWKVSIQMMIRRALDLQMVSSEQYQRAFRKLSAEGYRKKEPLDDSIAIDRPQVLADRFRVYMDSVGATAEDLQYQLGFGCADLEALLGLRFIQRAEPQPIQRIQGAKVIPLRSRATKV